jgi:hypothetical protein
MNNYLIWEPQEAGQMTVIMAEVEFPGLLARVGFFRKYFVIMIVMTEVLRGFPLLVPAIVRHRRPGNLEREQAQHNEDEKTSHLEHFNYYGVSLSTRRP